MAVDAIAEPFAGRGTLEGSTVHNLTRKDTFQQYLEEEPTHDPTHASQQRGEAVLTSGEEDGIGKEASK